MSGHQHKTMMIQICAILGFKYNTKIISFQLLFIFFCVKNLLKVDMLLYQLFK